jgi:hypothetical protein
VYGGVEGLHCGVGKMRRFVDRLHDLPFCQGILDIAVIARAYHRSIERIAIELGELRAVGLSGLPDIPFGVEQGERLLGAPEPVGNNNDGVVEPDHLQHAAAALCR